MARACCLPPRLLERAAEMADLLEKDETAAAARQQSSKVLLRRNEVLRVRLPRCRRSPFSDMRRAAASAAVPGAAPLHTAGHAALPLQHPGKSHACAASSVARLTPALQRDFVAAMTAAYAEDDETAEEQEGEAQLAHQHDAAQMLDDGHVSESIVEDDSQDHSDAIDED